MFLFRMHSLFGSHDFKLVPVLGGYRARCSCGAFLKAAAAVLALALSACSFNPKPKPPDPPPPPSPVCAEGQTTCCWHQPPDNPWLYACPAPNAPGGVVNVAGGPAQCLPVGICDVPTPPEPTPIPPTPGGPVPPKGEPRDPQRLVRLGGPTGWMLNDGTPFKPFGVEPCCMSWEKCPDDQGVPAGTGWPGFSSCFIKETRKYGANIYHVRWAPWDAKCTNWDDPACGEVYWAGIGGAYNADGSFSQPYEDRQRALVWEVHEAGGVTEVVPADDWWFKGACGKDKPTCGKVIPMSQAAVEAWGKTWHPEHDALYKRVVEAVGCWGSVIWATGNEEDLVPGTTREHLQARVAALRKYEQEVGCGFVHLIGTGSWKGGIGADYQITHDNAPLTTPCGPDALPCANNEHNPERPVQEEAARFQEALNAKGRYDAWRAGSSDADWEARLQLFKDIQAGGSGDVGCYAPLGDDPKWVDPPTDPAVHPPSMMAAYNAARAAVGDRTGATGECTPAREPCAPPIFIGCIDTTDLIAAELRKAGYCASGSWGGGPELAIYHKDGWWEQYHPCFTETGAYVSNPYKFAWQYTGENPTPKPPDPEPGGSCANPPAQPVDHCIIKEHTKGPSWTVIDSTFKIHDKAYCTAIGSAELDCPVRLEGDPQRTACEAEAVGTPVYSGPGEPDPSGNPYLWRVPRGTSGAVSVHASKHPSVTCSVTLTP